MCALGLSIRGTLYQVLGLLQSLLRSPTCPAVQFARGGFSSIIHTYCLLDSCPFSNPCYLFLLFITSRHEECCFLFLTGGAVSKFSAQNVLVFRVFFVLGTCFFSLRLLPAAPPPSRLSPPPPALIPFQHYQTLSEEENLPTSPGFHLSLRRSSPSFYLHPYVSAATARSYAKAAAGTVRVQYVICTSTFVRMCSTKITDTGL